MVLVGYVVDGGDDSPVDVGLGVARVELVQLEREEIFLLYHQCGKVE